MAQDLGNLSDYIVNGDNYTKVEPDGSTLTIPGQRGKPPIAPQGNKDTYREVGGDCSGGQCALFAHDSVTNFYYILAIATFDPLIDTCECALAGSFEGPDCRNLLQQRVDGLAGQPIYNVVPFWLLGELNIPLSFTFEPDFWFIGCYGAELTFPTLNKPPPVQGGCPPPGMTQLVNGVAVCVFDPPVPPFTTIPPFGLPGRAILPFVKRGTSIVLPAIGNRTASQPGTSVQSAALTSAALQKMRGLNPTLKRGIPYVVKPCGCNDAAGDFEEAIL